MHIPKRLTIKVNLDKVLKEHLYQGKKGTYLNLVLFNTPHNEYGDDYCVKQDIPENQRPPEIEICGNAKVWEPNGGHTNENRGAPSNNGTPPPQAPTPPAEQPTNNDGLPF